MSLLALIDYGLLVVYFLALAGVLLFMTKPWVPARAANARLSTSQVRPAGQTVSGEEYICLGALLLLLLFLAFLSQKEQIQRNQKNVP